MAYDFDARRDMFCKKRLIVLKLVPCDSQRCNQPYTIGDQKLSFLFRQISTSVLRTPALAMKTLIAQTVKVLTAVSVNKDLMAMASLVKVKALINVI